MSFVCVHVFLRFPTAEPRVREKFRRHVQADLTLILFLLTMGSVFAAPVINNPSFEMDPARRPWPDIGPIIGWGGSGWMGINPTEPLLVPPVPVATWTDNYPAANTLKIPMATPNRFYRLF